MRCIRCDRLPLFLVLMISLVLPIQSAISADDGDVKRGDEILREALIAMGGDAPETAKLLGTVTFTEGSRMENGTIKIVTRGIAESNETIYTTSKNLEIRSKGDRALKIVKEQSDLATGEEAIKSRTTNFPMFFVAWAVTNPDVSAHHVRETMIGDAVVDQVLIVRRFTDDNALRELRSISRYDIYVSQDTNLPIKLSYKKQRARGAVFPTRFDVYYSEYVEHEEKLYASTVNVYRNNLEWAAIRFISATWDETVSDELFELDEEGVQ